MWLIVCAGFILRLSMGAFESGKILSHRLEFVKPSMMWERALEGAFFSDRGFSPYSGDAFTGSPFLLTVARLSLYLSPLGITLLFAILDVGTALCLRAIAKASGRMDDAVCAHLEARRQIEAQTQTSAGQELSPPSSQSADHDNLPILSAKSTVSPDTVAFIYLLNPVSLAVCAACSGEVLVYFAIFSAICLASHGNPSKSAAILGITAAAGLDIPAALALILPVILLSVATNPSKNHSTCSVVIKALTSFVLAGGLTAFLCRAICGGGSWEYLNVAVEAQMFQTKDLTPNVGPLWYFQQQVFPEFRAIFRILFAFHPFLYIHLLVVRLGDVPHRLVASMLGITAIFGRPPSFAALPVLLCCAVSHRTVERRSAGRLLVTQLIVVAGGVTALAIPAAISLWLYAGTGNANFMFFSCLVYNFALALGVLASLTDAARLRKAVKNVCGTLKLQPGMQKTQMTT